MIHDTLLSCLDLGTNILSIEKLMEADAIFMFLHPSEKKVLEDILYIVNSLREIKKYADCNLSCEESYLNAFACGLNDIIQDYVSDIATLELEQLENSNQSLLFIYEKLRYYEPIGVYFTSLIRQIAMEQVRGCVMIKLLHKNFHHGDRRIYSALKHIHKKTNVVFLKQLSNWILYAKTIDKCDEFFIQNCNLHIDITNETDKADTSGSLESVNTPTQTQTPKQLHQKHEEKNLNIWDYEILPHLLPKCFSISWAEKVLFIGQTVLLFETQQMKNEPKFVKYNNLWNRQEYKFFKKIQNLQNDNEINIVHYENAIDEIKSYVTQRLSTIAINQAQLITQLRILKDYFLLSRGELYLEFIRKIAAVPLNGSTESKIQNLVKIFECAANSVCALGLEQISINIYKNNEDVVDNEHKNLNFLNEIQLNYKINWPLELLFSPKVMQRYNTVFRFLLRIKKIQYQLHLIWRDQIRESKNEKNYYTKTIEMHLHSQLMFFIDNFQYYIQVDVLESQFNLLINSVHKEEDFEKIQKAHIVFQANILSQCFLLTAEEAASISSLESSITISNNDIYKIFQNIFDISENFCIIMTSQIHIKEKKRRLNKILKRLESSFDTILNVCTDISSAQNISPLAQFLLRLDFNHWFSSRKYSLYNHF